MQVSQSCVVLKDVNPNSNRLKVKEYISGCVSVSIRLSSVN